ncbi:hypothetical protein G6F56_012870 [Rhizopus delemar]|nr:hypothetical protein G6F56_012870 [Rhizopus delemar]
MYNLQQRSSNLFSFAVTVLSTILGLVAVISYIQGYSTIQGKVELDAEKTKVVARRFGPENQDYKKKSEFVRFSFDVDADFTELFHWNTKQVFVRNTVVLWDKIITEKEKAHLKLKNIGNKYAMIDISQKWK